MSDIPEDMPDEYYASFNAPHLTVVDESFSRRKKPPTPPTIPDPPTIRVVGGFIDKTATEGEDALIASGKPIYQRGRSLVRPVMSEVPASKGRTTISAGLLGIDGAAMVDRLCQVAIWERYDARSKDWVRIDPPTKAAATILSRSGEWKFPPIAGVITAPTLRPDGTLLTAPGYDPITRLYHMADAGLDVRKHMPRNPTRPAALAALGDLQYLLKGFPFVSEVDIAVALSALISPVVRGALDVVPMHGFRASTAGTGKSYLVDVASAIATGRRCPVATVAKDETETEKRLAGLLLAAFPLICLDNVNGELGGDLLCQAIERPLIQIRPLGTSEIIEIESRATIFATGNALRVRGDMTRRSLISNLDAGMEKPEEREFEFSPVDVVLNDRARYVGAVLTIVMAHAAAGLPGGARPLASFEDWSRYVRGALIWLGCADPCISMAQAREDDPELSELTELLAAWKAEIGTDAALNVNEIVAMIGEKYHPNEDGSGADHRYPLMREFIIRSASGRTGIDARRLGNLFAARAGRIANGHRLVKSTIKTGNVVRWQLRAV